MNKGRFQILSSVVLATCFGVAANGCGGGDDDNGGGSSATGGSAGKGGKAGAAGASGAGAKGGSSGVGGSVVGTGGSINTGGSGGSSGSGTMTGGASPGTGGSGVGGTAGAATGGSSTQGGMGGMSAGGTGGAPSYCYESLYAPIAMPNDQADFEIDYGDATPIDLSATTLSVRLRAETTGNGGGVQVYVKNGAAQNYAAAYLGWNNLTDLSSFTVITKAVADLTGGTGFDPTKIRYVGVNINAGDTFDGANFQPATVYVDSITFSDGASADLDFNDGVARLALNSFNSPVAGATASAAVCQDETGSGGMGGNSGSAGSTASGGIGGNGVGGSGTEAGAAGLGGEGGVAGAVEGTGGSSVTGGTGGTAGASSGGASSGGASSGGAGNGGVSGSGTSGASGHAGAGGTGTSANLIVNGNFESGNTNNWTSWGTGTFAVTTTNPHSGNDALVVTGRTGSNTNILQNITSVVSLGHTYALSAWVRTSAAATGHFTQQIDCATNADVFAWVPAAAVDLSTTWTQITGTVDLSATSPCGSDTVSAINLYFEGPAAGIDVYLDDVTLTAN